ncbi:hypothetical protein AB0L40_10275 [Patulibacter sp. NPDC049589]|uniref:hypothetical protein n=1 Tax=Patulibacter sp. NPDC049589 TaxID=3154731 RepID=UPI003419BEC2
MPPNPRAIDEHPPTPEAPPPTVGLVAADAAAVHPGLALLELTVPIRTARKSPAWSKDRLARLSTSVDGHDVLTMHLAPVPAAFRALYKAMGRDPDADRPPQEEAFFRRLADGGFPHRGLPADALLIALAETGVPVWAVDADRVRGPLAIRRATPDDHARLEPSPHPPGARDLVVADADGPVAAVGRPPHPDRAVRLATTHARLYALQLDGVADMRIHEAFWLCTSQLQVAE